MRDFIQTLPKTETHLHLEGALPYELLTAWDPEQWPPDPQFRMRSYMSRKTCATWKPVSTCL
jgi:adenosine deaminase